MWGRLGKVMFNFELYLGKFQALLLTNATSAKTVEHLLYKQFIIIVYFNWGLVMVETDTITSDGKGTLYAVNRNLSNLSMRVCSSF